MGSALLKIKEVGGKEWELEINSDQDITIGRARDNDVVLNDQRASRYHAYIKYDGASFVLLDGHLENGVIRPSVNKVFINGLAHLQKPLMDGDRVTIGGSELELKVITSNYEPPKSQNEIRYDDRPLGNTQLLKSAKEIISHRRVAEIKKQDGAADADELKELRRKAEILDLFYEMSRMLSSVFDINEIFSKATDLIFRVTPADRVVALLADETADGKVIEYDLHPVAISSRTPQLENATGRMTVSRTITQKAVKEKVALLSQDAASDKQFSGSESIVSQGVRSTICAPLLTESSVHGVVYADRLDPFATFSPDDLELITAVAAQTAIALETIKAHKRLAHEEVARANYSRFLPEYVVRQILENPDSLGLGGVNQKITVLFADIRGFTGISEHEKPERIVHLLNLYFTEMTDIIFEHGGTLDKYIGDGLLALFGAPHTTPEDAKNALNAAVAMQRRLTEINQKLVAEGFPAIGVGIGMHTGVATVGYIGSDKRSEYTAIGDTVNLAARLESQASAGKILISENTASETTGLYPLVPQEPVLVKNRVQPVILFEVKWT
jgi:adenylate cyclase